MIILYAILLLAFSIYTYALVDPNITLINNAAWTQFRNIMVQLGYYQRMWSAVIFIVAVLALTAFHIYFLRHQKKFSAIKIALIVGVVGLLAYPFLSHDLFNYMFDARILTHYHQNPYMHTALDFPADQMTRFMHWTHRTYPYGPTFLLITLVPSFLSFGKFLLGYILFKLLFTGSYIAAVYYLNRWNKEWAIFFATQPLVIIEGLVNAHNDILAVTLTIIGLYYVFHRKDRWGRVVLVISGLIKYSTLPFIIATIKKDSLNTRIMYAGVGAVLVYLTFFHTVQPWYFLTIFALIPYSYKFLQKFQFFYLFILLSYAGYIATGTYNQIFIYSMILLSFVANIVSQVMAKRFS